MDRYNTDTAEELISRNLGANYSGYQDFLNKDCDCIKKDSEIAQSLRKKGNEMYYKRNCDQEYEETHEFYSKSIAFAPIDSDDLALAYGNRSALLHRIHKYQESILDIDRALEIIKSDIALRVKLLCRKVECLAALDSPETQQVYDQAAHLLPMCLDMNKNEKSILDNMEKAHFALYNIHQVPTVKDKLAPEHVVILQKKQLQNPFDSVAAQQDENFGKQLIATRDIKPGEIIFVEKPYAGFINNNKSHIYCSHCFTKTWASIPCDSCNWCMFCSKRCKDSAWMSYHDIECSTISYLMNLNRDLIEYPFLLSLRSIIMGVKESGSVANFRTDIASTDDCRVKLSKSGTIIRNGFRSIYSLCHLPLKIHRREWKNYGKRTIQLLCVLFKYTQFFGQNNHCIKVDELRTNSDVIFIGSVFLKLRSRTNSSFHIVHDANSNCQSSSGSINCMDNNCTKGACISSLTLFINHSCNPNVQKCVTDEYKVIIFSLLPIKKNSQLLMAYQQPFFEAGKLVRRHLYDIVCYCEACTCDWPTLEELWRMPKDNPGLYMKNYNALESNLYDTFDKLVSPIIINCQKVQYNQEIVRKLSNAIEKAASCLEQPSVVMCELITCLCFTFKKLYLSKSS